MRITRLASAIAVLCSAAAGCTADEADARREAPATVSGAERGTPEVTDPEIAHIAVTANAIDIEIAGLVDSRSTDPKVRGFAQTMIADHTAVNERAGALAQRLGVTPEDNAISQSLRQDAEEASGRLAAMRGAEFDRAYIEREVVYHQAVLDALDQTLIPGAENRDLRNLLQEVRPAIAAHLDHARTIQNALAAQP